MRYNEEIERTEYQLEKLRAGKIKFQQDLEKLKVGGEIYLEGGSGGFTMDYFPQEILEIDIPNCRVKVFEKSTNVTQWLTSYYAFENGKFISHD